MIVVDTTVLVYAVGDEHALREPCRALWEAVRDGRLEATTTIEVIQEFAHVRARRRGRDEAARLAEDWAAALSPLLSPTHDDLGAGLRLFAASADSGLGAFDCVLAATAAAHDAAALVSADGAFSASPVLHVVPDADGVNRLLTG